jgi:hypothetical protein
MVIFDSLNGSQVYWASGIPDNKAGDLQMVQAWKDLGFVISDGTDNNKQFYQIERNSDALGATVQPGNLILGQSTTRGKKTN